MSVISQPDILAGFPLLEALKAMIAVLGLVAGTLFAIAAVALACLIMPIAALLSLFSKSSSEKRRQGWRSVPV